jgi:hypothetical protein
MVGTQPHCHRRWKVFALKVVKHLFFFIVCSWWEHDTTLWENISAYCFFLRKVKRIIVDCSYLRPVGHHFLALALWKLRDVLNSRPEQCLVSLIHLKNTSFTPTLCFDKESRQEQRCGRCEVMLNRHVVSGARSVGQRLKVISTSYKLKWKIMYILFFG